MKPTIELARATTPGGNVIVLSQHDQDFLITVDRRELMNSRQHESEMELARLGCHHLRNARSPTVLIGGLGMGYTLRQALDLLGPEASVVVAELMPEIIDWQKSYLSGLNNDPLGDPRVRVIQQDVLAVMKRSPQSFDAILLDIDNGPSAMTDPANRDLYGNSGIRTCKRAMTDRGLLAVWSVSPDKPYEARLQYGGLRVRRHSAPPYKGSKSMNRFIFVASEQERNLPPGGGELRPYKRQRRRDSKR